MSTWITLSGSIHVYVPTLFSTAYNMEYQVEYRFSIFLLLENPGRVLENPMPVVFVYVVRRPQTRNRSSICFCCGGCAWVRRAHDTICCASYAMYLYSEHGLRAEDLELLLGVGVVVPLVALESRLLLGQRARLLVEAGVDDVRALLRNHVFR